MGAFQEFNVGEVASYSVEVEALFDQPVVRKELVLWDFAGTPELEDVLEVIIEFFDNGLWGI